MPAAAAAVRARSEPRSPPRTHRVPDGVPDAASRSTKPLSAGLLRRHRHLRPRLDAGVLGPEQALRRLHARSRTTRPASASRPTRRRSPPSAIPTSRGRGRCTSRIDDRVYNEVFMWAPQDRALARARAAAQRRRPATARCPLTPTSRRRCSSRPGRRTGPDAVENLRPTRLPGHAARASPSPPACRPSSTATAAAAIPCADTATTYMRCLDRLGANLVMQDEANPGRWAHRRGQRRLAAAGVDDLHLARGEPTRRWTSTYNVTPHMVGNLADLAFDGQTAITQRGLRGPPGVHVRRQQGQRAGRRALPGRAGPQVGVHRDPALGHPGRLARRASGDGQEACARL